MRNRCKLRTSSNTEPVRAVGLTADNKMWIYTPQNRKRVFYGRVVPKLIPEVMPHKMRNTSALVFKEKDILFQFFRKHPTIRAVGRFEKLFG